MLRSRWPRESGFLTSDISIGANNNRQILWVKAPGCSSFPFLAFLTFKSSSTAPYCTVQLLSDYKIDCLLWLLMTTRASCTCCFFISWIQPHWLGIQNNSIRLVFYLDFGLKSLAYLFMVNKLHISTKKKTSLSDKWNAESGSSPHFYP